MPGYIIHLAVGNEYIKNHPTEILDKDKLEDLAGDLYQYRNLYSKVLLQDSAVPLPQGTHSAQ